MNILIIRAHPDNYELGVAGTIKKHSSEGGNVFSIIMSNGEVIGTQNIIKTLEILNHTCVF